LHRHARVTFAPARRRGSSACGSYAYADTAAGIAVALTKNRLTADFSAAERIAGIVTKALA
jgi:hypothetical protein